MKFRPFLLLLCSLFAASYSHAESVEKEYFVKAAFMYNFVKFTTWPGDMAIAQHKSINICTLSENRFGKAASVFKEASTPALALHFVNVENAQSAAKNCHMVFISSEIKDNIEALHGSPVLTVSDADGFIEAGGMVGFVLQDNKIKIAVNENAASQAGLRIDAQLLEIAQKVIR